MDELLHAHRWNRAPLCVALTLLLAGCDSLGTTKKFSNPVVPPPPRERLISKDPETGRRASPRVAGGGSSSTEDGAPGHASLASATTQDGDAGDSTSHAASRGATTRHKAGSASRSDSTRQAAAEDESAGEDPIEQVANSQSSADDLEGAPNGKRGQPKASRRSTTGDLTALQSETDVEGAGKVVDRGEVAALVNGQPIFYDDVLLPFAAGLAQAESRMPPEEFRRQRNALVNKYIQPHIEQELLLQALRTKLKDDQLAQIKKHIDAQFDEELRDTMKRVGVSTPGELEMKLRKSGSSIETLRSTFRNRHLAQQYLAARANPKSGFDRTEIYEHYKNNPDKFAIPGRVKWQQIHLVYAKHGGKTATKRLAEQLVERLENGEDFGELARQYSDGPHAKKGGVWDWTNESSLKSKELDEALFGMPIGEEFARIDGPEAIDIVVVLDRHEPGSKTFVSVQTDIKNELKTAEFQRTVKELLNELSSKATLEKFTDD